MDKVKVLVVDDNKSFLDMLTHYLVDNSYNVLSISDGVEAKVQFADFMPDIVLTDIVMPGVDGIELLLELRNINPDISVIAMSGGNRGHADTYLHMADKLGANVILNKPFELSQLLQEIEKLSSAA